VLTTVEKTTVEKTTCLNSLPRALGNLEKEINYENHATR